MKPLAIAAKPERISYRIDHRDEIVFVSESWAPFAAANGAPGLQDGVVGRPLWDFVRDLTTCHLYADLIARVRSGRTAAFPYRCDAPERRRFMLMTMRPNGKRGVEFDSVTLRTEGRARIALVGGRSDTGQLLRICSWCKQVNVHGRWAEIEVAVEQLGVFADSATPEVTHAICESCEALLLTEIGSR